MKAEKKVERWIVLSDSTVDGEKKMYLHGSNMYPVFYKTERQALKNLSSPSIAIPIMIEPSRIKRNPK